MVKVIIKGGVWRNTEDEILKAAVMKYGKNQWSRIASLLHRKSAKQCKARWFEWLDPSIKKTEWSREEDEKLLHLAKLMPCQWRTIAPIVGRTSTQCLERYEYLLDQAQRKIEGGDEAGPSAAVEARKIKPGEIDPAPETKPARPDPIDMDEDEIQMLAEARARLANTQGKKAKRKAREKQLDEARRLASLQKRREMRAAGLPVGLRRMKKGKMDYNLEIPFEKHAPLGFHDPHLDNLDQALMNRRSATKMEVNYDRRDRVEAQKRKEDKMKLKRRRQEDGPDSVFNKKETPEIKRSKLVLPAPQISESEIEQIVKVGRATDSVRTLAEQSDEDTGTATLLSEVDFTPLQGNPGQGGILPTRTPLRTPGIGTDFVAQEAQNILALTNTQSAIKGGMNTPLVGDTMGDFSGITPQRPVAATPNMVLGTPRASGDKTGDTPGAFTPAPQTPGGTGATPMRDSLNINQEGGFGDQRDALRAGLKSLPKAKNDFELVIPDEDSSQDETDTMTNTDWIEDAAESDAREADKLRLEARQDWEKQTQSVQRHLPRPTLPNTNVLMPASMQNKDLTRSQIADEKVKLVMLNLLHQDALLNPTEAQQGKAPETMTPECRQLCQVPKNHKVANQDRLVKYCHQHPVAECDEQTLAHAEKLLNIEMEKVQKAMQHDTLTPDAHATVWKECYEQLMFIPHSQRYTRATLVSKKDRIDSYEKELTINRDTHMTRLTKRIAKKEKRLKVMLGGYQSRAAALVRQTNELHEQIERARIAVLGAAGQRERELLAIPKRIEKLRSEVCRQRERELALQKQYSDMKVKLGEARRDYHATISGKPVQYEKKLVVAE